MHDLVGHAADILFGGGFAIFVGQYRPEHLFALTAAEHLVGAHAFEHVSEHLRHEDTGELLGGLAQILIIGGRFGVERLSLAERHIGLGRESLAETVAGEGGHHITSISACSAPAALMACRIVIRSRGPMPSALRPVTSSWMVTPADSTASFLSAPSSTCTSVRGTTVVVPPVEKGVGCDT